jgi:Domain of unknown function (DUF3854)
MGVLSKILTLRRYQKSMGYLNEWSESGVVDEVTHLNVKSLENDRALDYLLYAEGLPRRNDGRLSEGILKRYQHLSAGGWWCSGVDILTGNPDLWGCFKPIQPRHTGDQKLIKYEHPPQIPTGIFALRVSLEIWESIAIRNGLSIISEDVKPDQIDLGFWDWVVNHPEIPLCITEGAKKAGALLSGGYVTIALPGINGGYRVSKDEYGNRIGKPRLIPQLQKLATPQRQIYLTFDQDIKPSTIRAVNGAIRQMGYLLSQAGCQVKVINWNPELGKGVDDLIANHGLSIFDEFYQNAIALDIWKAQAWYRLTYQQDIQVNSRYLPKVNIPDTAKLIAIKSAKGTGKTQLLEGIVEKAFQQGQKVLVIGHRVRLVEALCQRFGLPYITEVRDSDSENLLGYGLCIDSLHSHSHAAFNPSDWENAIVIIDEVEQVLWHGLNSNTCSKHRVAILKTLKMLLQNVLESQGKVFIADADLSDTSLDYLISLSGVTVQPFVICNHWKRDKEEAWQVYSYSGNTPSELVRDLESHIREGGKPLVYLSAQKPKSKWGTCTLESYLKRQFPDGKILRIDSESLTDPTHPAYGCMSDLDQVLSQYDIVLVSPAIETGVSIEIKGHFTSVWTIAQGIQGENSVRQALGRLRENVPRYLWVASQGFNQVGNGMTSISSLLSCGQKLTQLNIRLLQQADLAGFDDLEMGFQAESLLCWAKMAVRLNSTMLRYRESVISALSGEGHQVVVVPKSQNLFPKKRGKKVKDADKTIPVSDILIPDNDLQLSEVISEVRDRNYDAECHAIALSVDLRDREYNILGKQLLKTTEERRAIRKYELKQKYGIPVTSALVEKDDKGWYAQIRLHYFLTVGRSYLNIRDAMMARRLLECGEGNIFLPDFNRSQLGAMIGTMELLGISVLLRQPERELKNTDPDLQAMAEIAMKNRQAIKTVMGIGLALNSTPIMIVKRFLDKIGYHLECIACKTYQKKRVRVYRIVTPTDPRFDVFQYWLSQDQLYPGLWQWERDRVLSATPSKLQKIDPLQGEYIQLSLFTE